MGSVARRPTRLSQGLWPVILVSATLLVDVVALFTGYILTKNIANSSSHLLIRPITVVTVTIWPAVFAILGLYQPGRLIHPNPRELLRLLAASVVVAFLVLLIGYLTRTGFPLSFVPVLLGACLVNVVAGRVVTRSLALAINDW
jgi:FlaA1/EpsC-like NDP-sugar epimerase